MKSLYTAQKMPLKSIIKFLKVMHKIFLTDFDKLSNFVPSAMLFLSGQTLTDLSKFVNSYVDRNFGQFVKICQQLIFDELDRICQVFVYNFMQYVCCCCFCQVFRYVFIIIHNYII